MDGRADLLASKMIEDIKRMQFLSSQISGLSSKDLKVMELDRGFREFFDLLAAKDSLLDSVTTAYKKSQSLGNEACVLQNELHKFYKDDKYFEFTQKYGVTESAYVLFRKQLDAQVRAGKNLVPEIDPLDVKIKSIITLLNSDDIKKKVDGKLHATLVTMCTEAQGLVTSLKGLETAVIGLKAKTNKLNVDCASNYKIIKANALQVAEAIKIVQAKQEAAAAQPPSAPASNNSAPPSVPSSHMYGAAQEQSRIKARGPAVHPAPDSPPNSPSPKSSDAKGSV